MQLWRRPTRSRLPSWIELLFLAVGLGLVHRYAWIIDDAFVYYRYVDNLLFLKLGLVYNQGEYVEGYSSPFWALLLIPLRATGLDYWTITRIISVVSFTVFWGLLVRLNRTLSPPGETLNAPLAFLGVSYATLCYFTSGIEAPLVQIAAVLYALYVLNPGDRRLQVLVGLTPLIRYEHTIPFFVAALWGWRHTRTFPWRLLGTGAATMGAWLVFKVYYYAELLPNTFYLKNDTSVGQGLLYVWQTVSTYQLLPLLLLFALVVWRLEGRRDADPSVAARVMMGLIALTIVAYVIKIGGDPRHHRYLAFPFVLTVCATAGLAERLIATFPPRRRRWLAWGGSLAIGGLSFSFYPPQLDRHPVAGTEQHRPVDAIQDASWHRHLATLEFNRRRGEEDRRRRQEYRSRAANFRYRGVRSESMCVTAYHQYEYRVVQNLGLTDAFLARTNARADHTAHKFSLRPRARDLADIYRAHPDPSAALYRKLVESGTAPPWIEENIESIETIARKVYNRHGWRENLRLALEFPERIRIPDWRDDPEADLDP